MDESFTASESAKSRPESRHDDSPESIAGSSPEPSREVAPEVTHDADLKFKNLIRDGVFNWSLFVVNLRKFRLPGESYALGYKYICPEHLFVALKHYYTKRSEHSCREQIIRLFVYQYCEIFHKAFQDDLPSYVVDQCSIMIALKFSYIGDIFNKTGHSFEDYIHQTFKSFAKKSDFKLSKHIYQYCRNRFFV